MTRGASRWNWTKRKVKAARTAREENRDFSQKALFAFREKSSFS
jgi:hypothetical protein